MKAHNVCRMALMLLSPGLHNQYGALVPEMAQEVCCAYGSRQ